MTNRSPQNSVAFALAVTLPSLAGLWLASAAQAVSPSTFTTAAALLITVVGTTITLYRSGQGSGSMGQLLHAAAMSPSTMKPASGSATRSGS